MKSLLALLIGLALLAAPAHGAPTGSVAWLEAEQFADCGGWSNDPQFVAQMGSPYLLATGVGKPVKDAVTKATLPRAGQYRLWVRCKDWHPQGSPGKFQVLIGGKASAVTFGQAADDQWRWVDGGTFELGAGAVEVRLHDLSGWFGRCDAVVLSGDAAFRPSDDLKALSRQCEQCGGVSREIKPAGPYDVVVVGGGLAGGAAALVAARLGSHVALIQDRPVLGGNASVEIGVGVQGDTTREPLDPRETGVIEELDPSITGLGNWSVSMEKVIRAQKNLDLFLDTRATGVAMKDKATIAAVETLDVRSGARQRFAGKYFIDCTGDGWVGFWAGADYHQGSEGRDEFGESLGAAPNKQTMGNTMVIMNFENREQPTPFVSPAWAYSWDSPDDFDNDPYASIHTRGERPANWDTLERGRGRNPHSPIGGAHKWWVELGGMDGTIDKAEWIRDELIRINLGLWDYAKNHDPQFIALNRNKELVWMNYVPGTRESRRLMGDYVMTLKDYADKIVQPDAVAYCGWGNDIHHPQGFWAKGNEYLQGWHWKTSIPYRSLYSRNIGNLLMAGRDISVSHWALGSVRVMRTCCIEGQAAGTAAAIATKYGATPRGVYEKHLDELQDQLLKDGAYIMGRPNRDPGDLARTARVAASSVAAIENPKLAKSAVNGGLVHPLAMPRAVMFTAGADRMEKVALFLRNTRGKAAKIKAVLRKARQFGDFTLTEPLAEAAGAVPPKSADWVEFKLAARLEPGQSYFITLPKAPGLMWDLYSLEPQGTTRAYGESALKPSMGCYKFRLTPGGEPREVAVGEDQLTVTLNPANVINGWNRAVAGVPNSWAPDPAQKSPQWIELQFGKPVRFNSVHVTWQLPELAAAAYRLEAGQGPEAMKTVAKIEGNKLRRRVHGFEAVTADRLRLVVDAPATGGAPPQLCEIRVYDEK